MARHSFHCPICGFDFYDNGGVLASDNRTVCCSDECAEEYSERLYNRSNAYSKAQYDPYEEYEYEG
jgi:hypothetical protein